MNIVSKCEDVHRCKNDTKITLYKFIILEKEGYKDENTVG